MYCLELGAPVGTRLIEQVKAYEETVLANRS
jgi:L-rhamnose isomerase